MGGGGERPEPRLLPCFGLGLINFPLELAFNLLLSPAIHRVLLIINKKTSSGGGRKKKAADKNGN